MRYLIEFESIKEFTFFIEMLKKQNLHNNVKERLPIYLSIESKTNGIAEVHGFRANDKKCIVELEILFNKHNFAKTIFMDNYGKVTLDPLYIKNYKYGEFIDTRLAGFIIGDKITKIYTIHDYDMTKEPFINKLVKKISNWFK